MNQKLGHFVLLSSLLTVNLQGSHGTPGSGPVHYPENGKISLTGKLQTSAAAGSCSETFGGGSSANPNYSEKELSKVEDLDVNGGSLQIQDSVAHATPNDQGLIFWNGEQIGSADAQATAATTSSVTATTNKIRIAPNFSGTAFRKAQIKPSDDAGNCLYPPGVGAACAETSSLTSQTITMPFSVDLGVDETVEVQLKASVTKIDDCDTGKWEVPSTLYVYIKDELGNFDQSWAIEPYWEEISFGDEHGGWASEPYLFNTFLDDVFSLPAGNYQITVEFKDLRSGSSSANCNKQLDAKNCIYQKNNALVELKFGR